MIIICGKSIEEVEQNLEMAKLAIASGEPVGIGGTSIEDVEKGMDMLRSMTAEPITNPNYTSCPCGCCDCEEEEEEAEPCDIRAILSDFLDWLEKKS